MTTAAEMIDMIVECGRILDAQTVEPRYAFAPPWFVRAAAAAMGAPMGRHKRARSMRGRKRAFTRSWRPVLCNRKREGLAIPFTNGITIHA